MAAVTAVFRLGDLARRVGGVVRGDPDRPIRGVSTLESAGAEDLAFLTNPKYRTAAARSRAGAVIVAPGTDLPGRDVLEAPEPQVALAEILELFHPPAPRRPGTSPDARVSPGARVGSGVEIGPFAVVEEGVVLGERVTVKAGCFIGTGSSVGEDSTLEARVVLYAGTRVGARCRIHAGVVLGADGFGFATTGGRHRKIPQVGAVIVEDDVEIGANSTVDRGAIGDTVIGRGTKIDDLVMVAHGVRVGPDCLLVAQSGVAGSARLGARVSVAGQSGVAGHLQLGDDVVVAGKSAVFEDVAAGSFVAGVPAVDHRRWKRSVAAAGRLPDLLEQVRALQARVDALERESKRGGE